MNVVGVVVFGLLGVGALLTMVRLGRGPSLLDRVVATDSLLAITASGLAATVALTRDTSVLPALVVVSLLGFIGAVSVARYVGGMLVAAEREGEGADVGLPEPEEQRGRRP